MGPTMSPTLTRRVLAFLELNPASLDVLGLPGTVLSVHNMGQGPPLSREKLHEVCRIVWQTHQERLAGSGTLDESAKQDVAFGVLLEREPML
jgi:hypothetical protein